LLLRFVGNETVAEDLLSDVFFEVWEQAGRLEGGAAVTTWLLSNRALQGALGPVPREREQILTDGRRQFAEE
jgi:RNA polymerase sigma-70 factor (ECF subfamily)